MPLLVQATQGTPLCPLPRPPQKRTTETYGLTTTASPPPPAYDPTNLPPLERALLPIQPCPIMGFPTAPTHSEDDTPWNHPAPTAHQLPPPTQFILISSDNEDLDHLTPPNSDSERIPSPPP
ncbi:uncharacterized protein ARMOST_10196 [Armillaria ostoyae]|uniref:Uncharacterized protein n=1 Tax=Armillaria ostoyae TaxID=47428 RepID=A0A284RDM7_ARMOS|nr:uncharacterized protein ARMOST_10196 [Armillaria ostoyae]